MKRKEFLQLSGLSTLGVLFNSLELKAQTQIGSRKITILHTNDTHSNIDAFPLTHPKYPGMGGVAKRSALLQKIRKEEQNVILLDSGDIFQGTPYFNTYHGELEMKLMSMMKYDVATLGNHDFDIGLDGFKNAQKFADFPFVCANYDFKGTVLEGEIKPFHIIEKGGLKIGVFGIGIDLNGLALSANYEGMKYLDPIETANQQAENLVNLGCDLIICLSHLGFEYGTQQISDKTLGTKTKNIHLILGGHTHTFLEKPVIVNNLINQPVLINQTGWAGLFLGRIDLDFNKGIYKQSILQVE